MTLNFYRIFLTMISDNDNDGCIILCLHSDRELYIDGNDLQCEGVVELIKMCVDRAEEEAYLREEEARKKAEEEALAASGKKWINSNRYRVGSGLSTWESTRVQV